MTRVAGEETAPDGEQLAQWVEAVASEKDREAFAALFGHFAPRLKAYLLRLGAAPQEAEELAQEAMIMVWRRAASFDPERAAVSTWVFTIARNKRIDALRRAKRPELDPEDPALAPEPPADAESLLSTDQQAEALRRAISELPAEQAELVRMAYFEDKAHQAIAEETNLPLGTVKSRLRLALKRLRRSVGPESPEQET